MATEILTTFQLKRGTAERWVEVNPILKQGEPGFEFDTNQLKIGDGIKAWNDLPYITGQGISSDYATIFYVDEAVKNLIGVQNDDPLANTIWAAKNYTDQAIQSLNLEQYATIDALNEKADKSSVYTKEEIGDLNGKTVIALINDVIIEHDASLIESVNNNTKAIADIINPDTGIMAQVNTLINQLPKADGITIQEVDNKLSIKEVSTDLLVQGDMEFILIAGEAI